jgi:hypothetical protein
MLVTFFTARLVTGEGADDADTALEGYLKNHSTGTTGSPFADIRRR